MPKQCSTRNAPGKRRLSRKNAAVAKKGQGIDGSTPAEEDVAEHTEMARELVLAAWPGIVRGLIKKAMSGGYQQTKLLLDLCEITNTDASQLNEQRRRQLCDALLEGLGLSSAPVEDQAAEIGSRQDAETTQKL